jgi:dolichyl-phosphate-mannose-protein mannosyltransferase
MSVAETIDFSEVSRTRAASSTAMLAGLAAAKLGIQFAGIRSYGFFRDELYYLACGRHLAWGYIDQPPLIAAVAWLSTHLFGQSIVAARIFPVLAGAAVVVLTAMLADEFEGGRFAQLLAALTILFAPSYLAFDAFLSMNAFEPLFWLLGAWLIVRIVKGASPRLWLAFGIVAGLGLENKHTMLVFGFGIVAGLIMSGQARLLGSRWAWIGAGIALLIFLPNLIWEARHGWPQIEVVRNAQQFKNEPVSGWRFLGEQALFLDPVALPVWLCGLIWLIAAPEARRFRFLGFTYLVVMAVIMALDGKTYYPLPAYPMLAAAGGVAFERFASPAWRWLRGAAASLVIAGGIAGLPLAVPVLPVDALLRYSQALPFTRVQTERDATVQLSQLYADMFGWPELASRVASVYHSLPANEQPGCALLAGNYGEAGAIDYYGPALGLPAAISGHNSYFDWGPRNYSGECVIVFGERASEFTQNFGESQLVDTVVNNYGMPSEQAVQVYICRKPKAALAVLWPNFKLII